MLILFFGIQEECVNLKLEFPEYNNTKMILNALIKNGEFFADRCNKVTSSMIKKLLDSGKYLARNLVKKDLEIFNKNTLPCDSW